MMHGKDNQVLDVEKLDCNQVIKILKEITPGLAKAISELPNNLQYPFYRACYKFGSQIIDEHGVYLPLENGDKILINDPNVPENLQQGLGYDPNTSNPIGIILNKRCEFYIQDGEKTTPYTILQPGDIFGLSKNFNTGSDIYSYFLWDLKAGIRSIFMLAKVSNSPQHMQLKRTYGLSSGVPINYTEQWNVLREITLKTNHPWRAEVLFFDNQWANVLRDPKYTNFQLEMAKVNRPGIWHHQPSWDAAFGEIETKKRLKVYSADILETSRHLFGVAALSYPGFRPADDELSAPVKLFQEAYVNAYALEHCPTVMEAALLDYSNAKPVFYSLNWPTSPKSVLGKMDNGKSVIVNLSTLKQVVETYHINLKENLKLRAISLRNAANKVEFSFYDNEYLKYKGIQDVKSLPLEDARFKCEKELTFAHHSAFLKGLIKISPIEL